MRKQLSLLATAATAAAMLFPSTAAIAASNDSRPGQPPSVLATGLTAPLHLSVGRDGSVTVSEEFAGRLTRVDSHGNKTVSYESGDWDVAGNTQWHGSTYFLESQGAGSMDPDKLAGHIRIIGEDGKERTIGDFAALERKNNPDGDHRYGFDNLPADCAAKIPTDIPASYKGNTDSHPYGITATSHTIYVTDAGANSVVSVDPGSGRTRTVAVLPPRPFKITAETAKAAGLPECVVGRTYAFEPVPTDVEVGPDGWLYVTSLPGGPEGSELGARGAIFKVDPDNGRVKLVADGILSPTGLVLDEDGDMYVASLFGDGVVKIDRQSGKQTVVLAAKLTADVGLRNGTLYATTNALPGEGAPPDGHVVYVKLNHGPHASDEDQTKD